LSRRLWINAYNGLANVTNVAGSTTTHERDLLDCFGGSGSAALVDASM